MFGLACALIDKMCFKRCSLILFLFFSLTYFTTNVLAQEEHQKRYGGTLSVGAAVPFDGLHPLKFPHGIGTIIAGLAFDGLFDIQKTNIVKPLIVESWTCSKVEKSCSLKIRDNVYFHDGNKLDVKDVVYTLDSARKSEIHVFNRIFDNLESYEVVDKNVIKLKFKEYFNNVLSIFLLPILPSHIDFESLENNFIGTGPFVYRGQDENKIFHFVSNDMYYGGKSYLKEISLKTYDNNRDLWGAMLKGELDFALFLRAEDIGVLEKDDSFEIYKSPMAVNYSMYLNYYSSLLNDIRFRQALSYAIDKKNLVKQMTYGYGDLQNGLFGKISKNAGYYGYDVKKTQDLLKEIGLEYDTQKKVWLSNGSPLELKLVVFSEFKEFGKLAMLLRQDLAKVGIRLRVLRKSFADADGLKNINCDAVLLPVGLVQSGGFLDVWGGSMDYFKKHGILGYRDKELDVLIQKYKKLLFDNKSVLDLEKEIDELIYKEQLIISLYSSYQLHALRSNIKNVGKFFEGEDLSKIMYWYKEN